jgi:hypothetical protein
VVAKRFCVSMPDHFIVEISIACFSACSFICFCVFAVNTTKSFFIFSVSSLCLFDHLPCPSGEVDTYSSSSAAGLSSSFFGVYWMSSSPSMFIL